MKGNLESCKLLSAFWLNSLKLNLSNVSEFKSNDGGEEVQMDEHWMKVCGRYQTVGRWMLVCYQTKEINE